MDYCPGYVLTLHGNFSGSRWNFYMLCDLHSLPYCTHAWYDGVCKGSPYGNPTRSLKIEWFKYQLHGKYGLGDKRLLEHFFLINNCQLYRFKGTTGVLNLCLQHRSNVGGL